MTQATITLSYTRWNSLCTHLSVLRTCPGLDTSVTLKLNRAYKKVLAELQRIQEEIDLIKEKNVGAAESVLQAELESYGKAMQKIDIQVPVLRSTEFPTSVAQFGSRPFLKQDSTGKMFEGQTHFYDSYLELLDEVIQESDGNTQATDQKS